MAEITIRKGEEAFARLLDIRPEDDANTRKYKKKATRRGWATFQYLPDGAGGKLLDVGSAGGIFVPAYLELFHYGQVEVIALEGAASERRLKKMNNGNTYEYYSHLCDIELESWPIEDASFDTVVCTEVLEHMVFDPMVPMNEICRVLKPGGRALVTVPNAASDLCMCFLVNDMQPGMLRQFFSQPLSSRTERDVQTIRTLCHFHEYTGSELTALAEACGFTVEILTGISPFPPILDSAKFRLLKRLVHALFPRSKRIREDHLLAVLRKKKYTPLDQVENRFPEPLYRLGAV